MPQKAPRRSFRKGPLLTKLLLNIVSFRTDLKRAHNGNFNKLSPKHLQCCAIEFSDRDYDRRPVTIAIDIMQRVLNGMKGKSLCDSSTAASGLSSGAHPL